MSRRGLGVAIAMLLAILAAATPAALARTSAPGPAADVPESWLLGRIVGPEVHGNVVANLNAAHDLVVEYTAVKMQPNRVHRLVLAAQGCAHDFDVNAYSHGLTSNNRGQRSERYVVTIQDILISSIRTVRVLRGGGGPGAQIACGPMRLYDLIDPSGLGLVGRGSPGPEGVTPNADTSVAAFRSNSVNGIIMANTEGDFHFRVQAVITGLVASEEYSLVGGTAACDASWSAADRSARVSFRSNGKGEAKLNAVTPHLALAGDADGDADVDGSDFLAWRVRRASNGNTIGCYSVDGHLQRSPRT